jgi:hypothetical protein
MIAPAYLDDLRARLPVSAVVGRRIRLRKAGREWRGLSPFNNERSPSFYVNDQKGFWHDFSAGRHGDIFTFVMETEGVAFRDAVERCAALVGMPGANEDGIELPRSPGPQAAPSSGNQGLALEIWKTGGDVGGTIAASYLAARKLVLPEGVSGRALRFHPRCPWRNDADELVHIPALIGLYRDVLPNERGEHEPRAIQRRGLTPNGQKLGKPRALGPKGGCAVMISASEDITYGLHIGEGVETILAAMMHGFAPAWALGDTANVAGFPVLPGIDALTLIVDNDANRAGQDASSECFDRWTEAGREVWSVLPDAVGADMNDVGL